MIISINQLAYLPWLGYFHRIDAAQKHIELDHVQFEKNSFTNRNKIRTKEGSIWLTVPVKTKGRFGENPINQIEIENQIHWAKKHLKSIAQNYSKAPYFDLYFPFLEEIYTQEWAFLIDLIHTTNRFFLDSLQIDTPIIRSSTYDVQSSKSDLVLDLCLKNEATTYLSGIHGRDYLAVEKFSTKDIEILYDDYQHPEYTQRYENFEPYMSVLDILFNHGEKSLEIIRQGRKIVK